MGMVGAWTCLALLRAGASPTKRAALDHAPGDRCGWLLLGLPRFRPGRPGDPRGGSTRGREKRTASNARTRQTGFPGVFSWAKADDSRVRPGAEPPARRARRGLRAVFNAA